MVGNARLWREHSAQSSQKSPSKRQVSPYDSSIQNLEQLCNSLRVTFQVHARVYYSLQNVFSSINLLLSSPALATLAALTTVLPQDLCMCHFFC